MRRSNVRASASPMYATPLLAAGAACLLAGCPEREPAEPEAPAEHPAPEGGEDPGAPANTEARTGDPDWDAARRAKIAADRPEQKRAVVYLEGMSEGMSFELYGSPEGFPLPFSTYVAEDFIAESEDGDVRFVANFAGRRNDRAFVAVRALPEGSSAQQAKAAARAVAEEHGFAERRDDAPDRYLWSLAEYDHASADALGTVAVAEHAGRYVQIISHYPEDYSEGFVPRAIRLFEEWRWEDTGAWLTAEVPEGKDLADQGRSQSKSFRLLRPSPGQGIRSPVRVEGAARVFEGAFQIELEDGHDVVGQKLMQVEGAPAWGSFAIDLAYERPTSPTGTLVLSYESAKDGSRVEELRIPVAFLDRPLGDAPN